MLKITIPESEDYDPIKEEFIYHSAQTITLEHSLISLSKWESKWKKPFLDAADLTREETVDYVRCMCITPKVDSEAFDRLTVGNVNEIERYINDPMTATTFSDTSEKSRKKEIVTSEIIYYWMVTLNIPFECQKWHLNRLITLIRVTSIRQSPSKKMSKRDIRAQNRSLNAARRAALNSKG